MVLYFILKVSLGQASLHVQPGSRPLLRCGYGPFLLQLHLCGKTLCQLDEEGQTQSMEKTPEVGE